MPVIRLATRIRAPIGRCFDLMRDVRVHTRSAAQTGERVVGGLATGLLKEGDEGHMRRFLEQRTRHLKDLAEALEDQSAGAEGSVRQQQ